MASGKVGHTAVEVIHSMAGRAKVAQSAIEVLQSITDLPAIDYTVMPVGSLGDECDTVTIDAAWSLRNISSVTGDGSKYPILMDAQGDAFLRAFTDAGSSFVLTAHITGLSDGGGMIGLAALGSTGAGTGFSRYNDANTYLWALSAYAYAGTGPNIGATPPIGDHWLQLRRDGASSYYGRFSADGLNWSAWTTARTDSTTITQIGIIRAFTSGGSQTPNLERFIAPSDVAVVGAGVMQNVVEALVAPSVPAHVSHSVVEVLMAGRGYEPPDVGGAGGEVAHVTFG